MKNIYSKEKEFLLLFSELEKVIEENKILYEKEEDNNIEDFKEVRIKTITPLVDTIDLNSFFIRSLGLYIPKYYNNIFHNISYSHRMKISFSRGEKTILFKYNREYHLRAYKILKNICKIEKLKYEFLEENKELKNEINAIKNSFYKYYNKNFSSLNENIKYTTLLRTHVQISPEAYFDSVKILYNILEELESKLPKLLDTIEEMINGNDSNYEDLLYRGKQ